MAKIKNNFTLTQLGKEQIIVPQGVEYVNFTKIITLNESGAYLWNALVDKDFEVADVATLLMDKYDVSQEVAQKDAQRFFKTMSDAGILV